MGTANFGNDMESSNDVNGAREGFLSACRGEGKIPQLAGRINTGTQKVWVSGVIFR